MQVSLPSHPMPLPLEPSLDHFNKVLNLFRLVEQQAPLNKVSSRLPLVVQLVVQVSPSKL